MFLKENCQESSTNSQINKMEGDQKCQICTENLDPDVASFLPCLCGYKICVFCWNEIKSSESDPKCPLCRRTYSENPAKFEPLSADEMQKLKNKKKQADVKKKQKLAEDRKQLTEIRVVRRNLIYIHDLPLNFAKDSKTHNKFVNLFKHIGPIKKVVVLNASKNYAGQKAPFARAYVTYQKNEDALRALRVNENVEFEGRELKMSLGTTKYCSNYIKNVNCTNKDCVYLHEQAEAEASFTKDQIHAGKHIEYSQKLYDQYLYSLQIRNNLTNCEERNNESQQQHIEEDIENSAVQIESDCSPNETTNSVLNYHPFQETSTLGSSNNISHDDSVFVNNSSLNETVFSDTKQDMPNGTNQERFLQNSFELSEINNLLYPRKEGVLERHTSNLINGDSQNCIDVSFESKDDCNLDFDPVQLSLSSLNSLVISEKETTNPELSNSLSTSMLKKLLQQQQQQLSASNLKHAQLQQKMQQPQTQPIYSPNGFIQSALTTPYQQSRSQNSPALDYYNQSFRTSVQTPNRSSLNTAPLNTSTLNTTSLNTAAIRNQMFQSPLTIQLPRYPSGATSTNSMANGYSPQQQYMSQISPQPSSYLQQQSYENFNQQQSLSNFEQILSTQQQYPVNSIQQQRESQQSFSYQEREKVLQQQRHQEIQLHKMKMEMAEQFPLSMALHNDPQRLTYFKHPSSPQSADQLGKGGLNSAFIP